MSIYGSLPTPSDDQHEDSCARWEKRGDTWEISERPCDCGQPDAPIKYQGSHVLPSETDERSGYIDIASIPGWISRDAKDDRDGDYDSPWPFLRFGVNNETVVLTERHVKEIADTLNEWLALPKQKEPAA